MSNTYLIALQESLEEKVKVLQEIRKKNAEQLELTKRDIFPLEEFDRNAEEKSVLIYKLNKLDDGFELVYDRVRDELNQNTSSYKKEIKKLQELITKVTELGTTIQAEETRNKAAMEAALKAEKNRLKGDRSKVKAAKSYAEAMRKMSNPYTGIMDAKK